MKRVLVFVVFGCALVLAGCGGSSSSTPSTRLVKFTIDWPARSRNISAPASALSAVVTLTGANSAGGDVTTEVDRSANSSAYSQTYMSAQSAKSGTFPLSIKFYAQTGGAGDIVATASENVTINSDGTGIGTVAVTNKIATVAVTPGQLIFTPRTAALTYTAKDAQGNLVAVSLGSATWTQVDGNSALTVTPDGTATAVQRGLSNVKVSLDGVTSASTPIETTADPSGAPIVLTFDELPAMPTQEAGTLIPVENQLSNQYVSTHGISFASLAPFVAVCTMPPGTPPSPPNSIAGSSADGHILYGHDTPVTFTFSDPVNPSTPGATRSFSLIGDRDGLSSHTVEIDAYDAADNLIGTATAADTGGEVLSLSFDTPKIHKVVFLGGEGTGAGVGLDNITFGPVIPVQP